MIYRFGSCRPKTSAPKILGSSVVERAIAMSLVLAGPIDLSSMTRVGLSHELWSDASSAIVSVLRVNHIDRRLLRKLEASLL